MEKNRLIRPRLPDWLKRPLPPGGEGRQVRRLLKDLDLATVCQSARCPNQAECFARGTATFMILGHICTRSCRFCAVPSGKPEPVRADEPHAVAEAAARAVVEKALELTHGGQLPSRKGRSQNRW